jgi:hypothetical protein
MITRLYQSLVTHFNPNARQDVADAMMGPEREDWFNAEAICAIGKSHHEWWVYGEKTYQHWCDQLKLSGALIQDFAGREPDLFCVERANEHIKVIGEAKLVRRSTDPMPFGSDDQRLIVQLDRARHFALQCTPSPLVCGLVYGLYNPANMFTGESVQDEECEGLSMSTEFKTASPQAFFKYIEDRWTGQRANSEWVFWRGGMQCDPSLSGLCPRYSNLASALSLGIGILLHKTAPELNA